MPKKGTRPGPSLLRERVRATNAAKKARKKKLVPRAAREKAEYYDPQLEAFRVMMRHELDGLAQHIAETIYEKIDLRVQEIARAATAREYALRKRPPSGERKARVTGEQQGPA
jgi:hypothetical protein